MMMMIRKVTRSSIITTATTTPATIGGTKFGADKRKKRIKVQEDMKI